MSDPTDDDASPLERYRELARRFQEMASAGDAFDPDELIRIGIAIDEALDAMTDEERMLVSEPPAGEA